MMYCETFAYDITTVNVLINIHFEDSEVMLVWAEFLSL